MRQLRELPRAPPTAGPPTTLQSSHGQDEGTRDHTPPAPDAAEQQLGEESGEAVLPGETAPDEVGGHDKTSESRPSLNQEEQFLFKCLLNVIPEEGDDLQIEMHWVEGHNKDLMNQLCTYLKNTLLKSVTKS